MVVAIVVFPHTPMTRIRLAPCTLLALILVTTSAPTAQDIAGPLDLAAYLGVIGIVSPSETMLALSKSCWPAALMSIPWIRRA